MIWSAMFIFVGIVHIRCTQDQSCTIEIYANNEIYIYCGYLNGMIRGNSLMWIAAFQTDHRSHSLQMWSAFALGSVVDVHYFE